MSRGTVLSCGSCFVHSEVTLFCRETLLIFDMVCWLVDMKSELKVVFLRAIIFLFLVQLVGTLNVVYLSRKVEQGQFVGY